MAPISPSEPAVHKRNLELTNPATMDLDIDTWCPVCDRLIVQPAPPASKTKAAKGEDVPQFIQPVAPKLGRGKSGTIRVSFLALRD